MANSDKNLTIRPRINEIANPVIEFVGADAGTGPQTITAEVTPADQGTVTFAGTSGTILTLADNATYKLDVNGASRIAGDLTVTGNTTISGSTTFDTDIIPNTDNTGNVGTAALTWNDGRFTNFTVDSTLTTANLNIGADTIAEYIADTVGAMVTSNTESGISVTYQDADNTLDFDVGDFSITLTGAVTGSGTVTNLGNVSIATTHTADPTLTLDGDVSGSATFTNLGNATLTVTIADDSHNHIISNVDGLQTALDDKLNLAGGTMTGFLTISHAGDEILRLQDNSATGSPFITLHQSTTQRAQIGYRDTGDYIYLYNSSNGEELRIGSGVSGLQWLGNGSVYTVWHSGNDGAGTGLDADTLDGQQGTYYLDWTNVTNKPDPQVTVTLTGDVTGTANTTLTDLGNGTVSVATTIAANSVALGTDTTGNYVAGVTAGALIDITGSAGEGWSPTVAVDLSELTDMTAAAVGTDELVILDGGVQRRKAINEITLGLFNTTNQIALGTDTTGNYIATITGTANQVTVTGSGSETAAVTLSLPQNIHTGASPTFAGATLTGNILLGDNNKAVFGNDSDLEIYHDGFTSSFVSTSNVRFRVPAGAGNNYQFLTASSENLIYAEAGDGVYLYFDNSEKLATTSAGINVNGSVTTTELTIEGATFGGAAGTVLNVDASVSGENEIVFANSSNADNVYKSISQSYILRSTTNSYNTVAKMLVTPTTSLVPTGNIEFLTDTGAGLATRLKIDGTTGNVGIGEFFGVSPDEKLHVDGNLKVAGNLTVSGTTTTINTETLNLADNIIVLNSNEAGVPSQNSGIEIERGTSANVVLQWNETSDYWEIASGGTTGRILTTGDEGTGNGLDADTVDGFHSYQGEIRDARADGDITPADYPEKSFQFTFTDEIAGSTENWDSVLTVKGWSDTYQTWQLISSSDIDASDTNLYFRTGVNTAWGAKQKIWTDANDGTGSGLDADTLDGQQGTSFLRSDADDTVTSLITTSRSGEQMRFADTSTSGSPFISLYQSTNEKAKIEYRNAINALCFTNVNSSEELRIISGISGLVWLAQGTTNVVWHSGNDGAGTGLDADTLDGQQGTYYLDWTNVTNKPDPQVTVTLTGDVTGTANTTLTDLGNGTVSVATTIAANSVALGTDTTGSYVQQGATSGNGISGSVNSEGGTFTVTSNATNANTASTIVFRDASGNFSAGTITATLSGTATRAQTIDTEATATNAEFYPTFVSTNTGVPVQAKTLFTDSGITYNPNSNKLFVGGVLEVNGTAQLDGNVILGNATSDTITFTGRQASDLVPSTDNTRNLGAASLKYNTVYATLFNGTALEAYYADLAENYEADQSYEPGTVLVFGGEKELTTTITSNNFRVAGVVSTEPATLMNSKLEGDTVVPLALQGRVPCKVIGRVEKGDMIVTSSVAGYGMVNNQPTMGTVIGKAVGIKTDTSRGWVEVVVGRV